MASSCNVCDGEDFNEIDGQYFCSVCDTQNEQYRVIEAEEFVTNFTFSSAIPSGPKEKRSKKRMVQSKPWTCDEAFLSILIVQSKALVELGAPPSIRDVIFRLWSTFLSRIGSAFSGDNQSQILRERDKWVGNQTNPRIRSVLRRKAAVKGLGMDFAEVDEILEEPMDTMNDDVVLSMDGSELSLQTLRKRPLYMRLATTLAICHIGLLYTTDMVTSSDIISWTKDGCLPYHKIIDLLPEFMEFSAKDLCTFVPLKWMTSRELRNLTGKLMYRLRLIGLPGLDVEKLICRYVAELELPIVVNGLACRLYRHTNMKIHQKLTDRARTVPCYEAIAMSYIIVIMCLIYGCDDVTEKRLDREVYEKGQSTPLFRFSEWQRHIDQKLASKRQQDLPAQYDQLKTYAFKFSSDTAPTHSNYHCKSVKKIDRPENRSALQNSLRTLLIRSESRFESRRVTSMDTSCCHTPCEKLAETSGKNFRYHGIYHLYSDWNSDRHSVCDTADPNRDSVCGTADSNRDSVCGTADPNRDSVCGTADPNRHSVCGTADPNRDFVCDTADPNRHSISDAADSDRDCGGPYENYTLQWITKSDTFAWLLKVCSEMADCDSRDIELIKERLELVFLLGYSTSAMADLSTAMRKRIVHSRFFPSK